MTERIPFDKIPKYLGVTLDCAISYHQHLLNTGVKVTKYCHLLKGLSSNSYGGDFTTSSTSELPLYFSLDEYCCRIWSQSHHCKKLDSPLNKSLRQVSGSIKSTLTKLLSILTGIEPVDIRRNKNILSLCLFPMEDTHIFLEVSIFPLTNTRLKRKIPLSTRMHRFNHDIDKISPEEWAQDFWRGRWENTNYHQCVLFNHLWFGHG